MPRLVPGMRIWNKASGLKYKENGSAQLFLVDVKTNDLLGLRVLVKVDSNGSYYWWKYNGTFSAVNQPNPLTAPDVPSHAFNQATKNLNDLKQRAYAKGRY